MKKNDKTTKILYVAPAEIVPGNVGGSVHVEEVARGLARLGYEMHLLLRKKKGLPREEVLDSGIRLYRYVPNYKPRFFLFMAKKFAKRLTKKISPDFIIERYYNFGGAGVWAARQFNIPLMLEVNSPAVDHKGSMKKRLDSLLMIKPMKRYREFICRSASDIITPLKSIIPPVIEKDRIHQITWGAAVERFHLSPDKKEYRKKLGIRMDKKVFLFMGAFRKWHGVWDLAKAVLMMKKGADDLHYIVMMVGGGPEVKALKQWVMENGLEDDIVFTGSMPYEHIPDYCAAADVGVAPYNPDMHKQLILGFYWSPLKIFEYMAAGIPVITIDIDPLNKIVNDREEGWLYPQGNIRELASRIESSLNVGRDVLKSMGTRGRAKVKKYYSWQKHCRDLDKIIRSRLNLNENTDNN